MLQSWTETETPHPWTMKSFVRLGRPTGTRGHRREKNFPTRIAYYPTKNHESTAFAVGTARNPSDESLYVVWSRHRPVQVVRIAPKASRAISIHSMRGIFLHVALTVFRVVHQIHHVTAIS